MPPILSVVVCTYNRVDLLKGCLDSLADQTAPASSFEVIVVDNNSSDTTLDLLASYHQITNLRFVCEGKQGLSHSRNRGIFESRGDYVAFLDDDSTAESHYIENALNIIQQNNGQYDCLGGPILPFYTTPKPDWFKDEYEIRRLHTNDHLLKIGQVFSGSNMIWKRTQLNNLGGFNSDFGLKGDLLILGEDTILFDQLWAIGTPLFFYSRGLIVFHWVPANKMKVIYRLKRYFAVGQAEGKITKTNTIINKADLILTSLFQGLKLSCKALIRLYRYNKIENWLVEEICPIIREIGKILSYLNINPNLTQRVNKYIK